jgi:hypothetical protein
MIYKLFLDDVREIRQIYPHTDLNEWILVKNYDEFVNCIKKNGMPIKINFDHDLGLEHYVTGNPNYDKYKEKTGYDCAKWLVEYCMNNNLEFPDYQVHSMNPIGRENIRSYIESYKKSRK